MSTKYSEPPTPASTELKLYQAFIFSVPIFFTFVLLFLFYLFYLRRRRVDWSSLRMRATLDNNNDISRMELGLKKEVREMLPIIIFKESFSIKDTLCSVCLGDYQAEDKLQQIPSCGHAFHMDCIDHWLAIHSTCPLCRLSLLVSAKPSPGTPDSTDESETSAADTSSQHQDDEESQAGPRNDESGDLQHEEEERSSQSVDHEEEESSSQSVDHEEEERSSQSVDHEEEEKCSQSVDHEKEARNETEKHSCGVSA